MYPETLRLIEEKRQAGVFPGAVFSFIEDEHEEIQVLGNSQVEPEEIFDARGFSF